MKKFLLIIALLGIFILWGCHAKEDPMEDDVLSPIQTEYQIGADGGEIAVSFSTNVACTVTPRVSWITVPSKTKAVSTQTITVTVQANSSTESRSGKVTISGGSLSADITVTQSGKKEDSFVPSDDDSDEDIILPSSVPDEISLITFTDRDGNETKAVTYPGMVVVRTVDNVAAREVRKLASDLGGNIIGQIPDIGYYIVSVTPGKEAEFISSARKSSICRDVLPDCPIVPYGMLIIDTSEENHKDKVAYFLKGQHDDINISIDDISPNRDIGIILGKLAEALKTGGDDMINISMGHIYSDKTTQKFGDDEKLNNQFINNQKNYWSDICKLISRNNSSVPVVVAAGNYSLHKMEKILDDMQDYDILGDKLFIVCAEQKDESYSNSLENGKRRQGVVTVNIDDAYYNGVLRRGTSFAAPKFCRFCHELVKATQGTQNEMTYAQAAKYLNEEWIKSGLSSITNEWKNKIIRRFQKVSINVEGLQDSYLPQLATYTMNISFDAELEPDETWGVRLDCDWMDTTVDMENNQLILRLNGNPSTESRSGQLTFYLGKGDDDDLHWDIDILQEGVYLNFVTESNYELKSIDYVKGQDLVLSLAPNNAQANVKVSSNLMSLQWKTIIRTEVGFVGDTAGSLNLAYTEDRLYTGSVSFPPNENGCLARLTQFLFEPKIDIMDFKTGKMNSVLVAEWLSPQMYRMSRSIFAYQEFKTGEKVAVDLGLTSGLKWATCNVGATAPEEYGDYYAWGEVEPYYSSLNPLTWKSGKSEGYDWPSYRWCNGIATTLTKYNTDSSWGNVDNKTILDPEDDVAHVNWAGSWRMPTHEEWTELRTECTWTQTTQNGVYGYLVTGPNGNSIFLPDAGYLIYDYLFDGIGGTYGSSSLNTDGPCDAWYVTLERYYVGVGFHSRCYGQSVRPVSE